MPSGSELATNLDRRHGLLPAPLMTPPPIQPKRLPGCKFNYSAMQIKCNKKLQQVEKTNARSIAVEFTNEMQHQLPVGTVALQPVNPLPGITIYLGSGLID
jgi:hypothetical protein